MFTGPVQSVKEHKKITDEIDDAYMASVNMSTELQAYLVNRAGKNRREQFLQFYRSFHALFVHTRYMNDIWKDDLAVEENKEGEGKKKKSYNLVNEIELWFADCKKPQFKHFPVELIEDGLELFSDYQKRLITKGVITISR